MIKKSIKIFLIILIFVSCTTNNSSSEKNVNIKDFSKYSTATFAGGCFWCMEPPFDNLKGVKATIAGYSGGTGKNPTYNDYVSKGYIEAVQIKYDPKFVTYEKLLSVFWRNIDPTDPSGQFYDRGHGYITAVFYHNENQRKLAVKSKNELEKSKRFDKPIATKIIRFKNFYKAEEHHQDFYKKNPSRYYGYHKGSGREQFKKDYWPEK